MNHPERFHALDATRAFALLLGVIFHGVWFYVEEPFMTAVTDVSANGFFSWFFHTSHTFRMQLFFLIAGFFARLVIEKRGAGSFMRNRLLRIGVPFLAGWLIIFPLVIMVWVWGRNLSGQSPVELPPHLVGIGVVLSGAIFVAREDGGGFGMAHLWFLYYLLVLYVVLLLGRFVLARTPLANTAWLARCDRCAGFLMKTPGGALVFAAMATPLLWAMKGWAGIDTPAMSRTPIPSVTAAYFLFFLLGWFLHRQSDQLGKLFLQWKFYLAAGILLSIGLHVFHEAVRPYDTQQPPHALSYRDVTDWTSFRSSLAKAAANEDANHPHARLWSALGPRMQGFATAESVTVDQQIGILMTANGILGDPDFLTPAFRAKVTMQEPRVFDPTVIKSNREVVQPFLEGVASGDFREESWYQGTKLAYAALYSVVMVFLVYGCLGAFQAMCQAHSPTWRYLADSSYWVYLIHIPLLPAIETLVFEWPITGFIKLPLVCAVSLLLLYASYHYMVRSTFLGKILNGRAYPFHWNPLHAVRGIPDPSNRRE